MSFTIRDSGLNKRLQRNLRQQQEQKSDALSKLSSGSVFTTEDPKPSRRALAEKMEFRLRGLAAAKTNVNDAVSLVQTAESALSEINNSIVRLKEINITAASSTISDQERKFLFIEYQAIHDELNRIAEVTEFNGIPLLNGGSPDSPEELIFRVDDPFYVGGSTEEDDINTIIFDGFRDINTTAEALGLASALELIDPSAEGISLEDAQDMLTPADDTYSTSYDEAIGLLSTQRAVFGSLQERFQRIIDFNDVYQENISAAKSKIADTDFAETTADLVQSRISLEATTAVLTQVNFPTNAAINLIKSAF